MKTVTLTDEIYTALLSLGVIKEEQQVELLEVKNDGVWVSDPHKGFVVGKKYKEKDGAIAYYCGINNYGHECWELITANFGMDIFAYSIPEGWISKASNKYWLISHDRFDPTPIEEGIQPFEGTKWVKITECDSPMLWYYNKVNDVVEVVYHNSERYKLKSGNYYLPADDCTEVEAPIKELKPWEKYPTLESCWEKIEDCYNVNSTGELYEDYINGDLYNYSTEAEAKKARATIFLSRIARKWNGGTADNGVYFVEADGKVVKWNGSHIGNLLPFYFHTQELAEKSLELFPDVWNDFYGR